MFGALHANAVDNIGIVEHFIHAHDHHADHEAGSRQAMIKQYAVASCVTRLYAIYERLVESLISDYLDAIPEIVAYADLSEIIKNEYRLGVSHVLGKLDTARYGHLSHENIIQLYYHALNTAGPYQLLGEAFTRHEQNLRLGVVEGLIARVDLDGFQAWLSHCPMIGSLYEEQTAIRDQLEAELKLFIQARNDAAHGVLETLPGKDIMLRYCTLIRNLIGSLIGYFHKSLVSRRAQRGRMQRIGIVTEVFSRAGAFIATLDANAGVQVGMQLHFVGQYSCSAGAVVSLQIDGTAVDSVSSADASAEVGVRCDFLPRRHVEILRESE